MFTELAKPDIHYKLLARKTIARHASKALKLSPWKDSKVQLLLQLATRNHLEISAEWTGICQFQAWNFKLINNSGSNSPVCS